MTTRLPSAHAEVSIILPVFNDETWVARAIESCLAQTLEAIEIIVVDDASTDSTTAIVEQLRIRDDRIKLIKLASNGTALRARRIGLENATAEFVMFLDGDDELVANACSRAVETARKTAADVVGFGSVVVAANGSTGSHYEKSMQPQHRSLHGDEILEKLFPVGKNAQGQLWRYLFDRVLLEQAYSDLPPSLTLPRMNDLPIAFLAFMRAKHYVSIKDRLYRYFFHRGASGHQVATWSDYEFNASALASVQIIEAAVTAEAEKRSDGSSLIAAYASARSSVIGRVLNYVGGIADSELQSQALAALTDSVGQFELALASSDFCPGTLPMLVAASSAPPLPNHKPTHVMLRTGNLRTGGVQGVVVAQAEHLSRAGVTVTIVIDSETPSAYTLPANVKLLYLEGQTRAQRISNLAKLCRDELVDVVIDHHIFYNDRWPYYAHALGAAGIPTIGWIHNFAMRPLLDEVNRLSFLDRYLPTLSTVVVLSEPDVVYWKLRGMPNVVYLPNPTSQLVNTIAGQAPLRSAPSSQIRVVWWGRLQQRTKQVLDLVDVCAHLQSLGVDFELTIVGPDGPDLNAKNIRTRAQQRGILDRVKLLGELHGADLVSAVQDSHVFVSTSIVEGYPLALVEAQALGLPVIMYDLPWLEFVRENSGVVTVNQGDRMALARVLSSLIDDPDRYDVLASGAIQAAERETSYDFEDLYFRLLQGTLGADYSPAPSPGAIRLLFDQNIRFVERLDRVHRREVKRKDDNFAQQLTKLEERANIASKVVSSSKELKRTAPAVPGLKAWLQRFLPATMRQAAYYARHEYSVASRQHDQILSNQAALSAQLARIESQLPKKR